MVQILDSSVSEIPQGSKIIYLPAYAKKQLMQADPARKWYNNIQYRTKPSADFPLQTYLKPEELETEPLNKGTLEPASLEDLESVIERMTIISGIAKAVSNQPPQRQ